MTNDKAKQFVKSVKAAVPGALAVIVPIDQARAAADMVEKIIEGGGKGGRAARGKSGPKIKLNTPEAEANRNRVKKSRSKQK